MNERVRLPGGNRPPEPPGGRSPAPDLQDPTDPGTGLHLSRLRRVAAKVGLKKEPGSAKPGSAKGAGFAQHIRGALKHRFMFLLGAGVLLLTLILTVVVERLPTTYAATSIVALRSRGTTDVPADEQKLLAGEYAVFLSTASNTDPVTRPYRSQLANGTIAVTVDPDTTTLRIVVTTTNKMVSAAVANDVASLAVTRSKTDQRAQILTLAHANGSSTVTGPPRALYLGAGFVLIAVFAGSAIYLRGRVT